MLQSPPNPPTFLLAFHLVLFALPATGWGGGRGFLQDVVNDVVQMVIDVVVTPSRSVGEEVTVITPLS